MKKYIQQKVKAFKKKAKKKPIQSYGLLIIGSLMLLGFLFIGSLVISIHWGFFGALPSNKQLSKIQNDNASIVYSADNEVLGKFFVQNRTSIRYDDLSPYLVNALIATEDARFLEHKGIDYRAWARVLIKTVLLQDQSGGGGSTLSQQLAKNLFPRASYWKLTIPVAKIKEMMIATRLEKIYDKDQLLNLYLNTVPFGPNEFGVQAASKAFFNKNAKNLAIQEAAVLVGMLKANTRFNPVRNPKLSEARRNVVLGQLARYGYLKPSELDSLKNLPLVTDYQRDSKTEGLATYFREQLRQELKTLMPEINDEHGEEYNLFTDGLKIYTTIESRLQRFAEEAVHEHLKSLQRSFDEHWKGKEAYGTNRNLAEAMVRTQRYKSMKAAGKSEEDIKESFEKHVRMTVFTHEGDKVKEMSPLDSLKYYYCLLNAGFLAADPHNGKILAWVGGIDQKYLQYDHVRAKRQTGSTFKPIVYATALRSGIGPCDYIPNRLVTYSDYDDWQPENSGEEYGGYYTMEGGIRKSINSIAVNLIMRTGVDSVRTLAEELGISSDIPKAPAIALGTADVSLYDMVQVYQTFANHGVRNDLSFIDRIETKEGKLLYQAEAAEPIEVLTSEQSGIMDHLLQAVVDSGTARRLRFRYQLQGPLKGKTGTTQSHADGWFMGYNSNIVAGSWVGAEYPSVRFRTIDLGQGANTALPIFGIFMRKVSKWKATQKWAQGEARLVSDELAFQLDCPPYLEYEPMEIDSTQLEHDPLIDAFDDLIDKFRRKPKTEPSPSRVNTPKTRKPNTEAEKERERVRRKNERLRKLKQKKAQRKKKKNKKWGGLFGN